MKVDKRTKKYQDTIAKAKRFVGYWKNNINESLKENIWCGDRLPAEAWLVLKDFADLLGEDFDRGGKIDN